MSSSDYWLLDLYCRACQHGDHDNCDPVGHYCHCWACLPNDHEDDDE